MGLPFGMNGLINPMMNMNMHMNMPNAMPPQPNMNMRGSINVNNVNNVNPTVQMV